MSLIALALSVAVLGQPADKPFRPPAVPLVTHDPYFSVWSFSDKLTDSWPRHWTGKTMGMCGMVRIDGKAYRWCGTLPSDVPAMEQKSVVVGPVQTAYIFRAGGIELNVKFASLPHVGHTNSSICPLSSILFEVHSTSPEAHTVALYADFSAEWCVNTPDQRVRWSRARVADLDVLMFASQDQPVLAKSGDDLRIDWGSFVVAAPKAGGASVIAGHQSSRHAFMNAGVLRDSDDLRQPRAANDDWPVLAFGRDFGRVGPTEPGESWWSLLVGYDDQFPIELFGRRLRPEWSSLAPDLGMFLRAVSTDPRQSHAFLETEDDVYRALCNISAVPKYGPLAALAFRQTMAAHKICADWDGTPLMFPKENFSNGCISTVDVIFPSSPFFLYFNPELLKAQLRPLMDYAASARWKFPFAPHDLGTYPLANGQVYGGGEKTEENQMPVEETGNMLIMLGAIAQQDGNADFAAKWWPTIEKWAAYLKDHALDPANQLCTDDFAGHLAHNANLAIKGIIGLGAYAQLCERLGKKEAAAEYKAMAERFAMEWVKKADDGDHYRLAYDKPGTWSQKYNLIWDKVLGTGLFPKEVAEKEMAFYRKHINKYGLPLDSREKYAKLDFSVWTACLTGSREDFEAIVNPLYDFANETPDRVPLTDWYGTVDGKCVGFRARSVVGAVYMPMLLEKIRMKEGN